MKKLLIVLALGFASVAAVASDEARREAEKVIELKDGSTVYIFQGGKMAMEDKQGRATRMKPGHVMETRDGQQIVMIGDEVARLDWLLQRNHVGQ